MAAAANAHLLDLRGCVQDVGRMVRAIEIVLLVLLEVSGLANLHEFAHRGLEAMRKEWGYLLVVVHGEVLKEFVLVDELLRLLPWVAPSISS